MKLLIIILILINSVLLEINMIQHICGVDYTNGTSIREGVGSIEDYPWLGRLFYPISNMRLTTGVVLVTREIVVAAAADIDKYPKSDFRRRARVVLGRACSGSSIGILEYTFNTDYAVNTFSALALIQLNISYFREDIPSICPPPTTLYEPDVYAFVLSDNCKKSKVTIHKMSYVDIDECKVYYRRSGLDVEGIWPTHTICAKGISGGNCIWKNGAVLALRENNKWYLLGFGVNGPGCESPSRFVDYGMHHGWVRRSMQRAGAPIVTEVGPDYLILRKKTGFVQRMGPCDLEEVVDEIYTDTTTIIPKRPNFDKLPYKAEYNVTLFANVDYSCVVFTVIPDLRYDIDMDLFRPTIKLRRWCLAPPWTCYDFQWIQIDFLVVIEFRGVITYKVMAYGREVIVVERKKLMVYTNRNKQHPYIG